MKTLSLDREKLAALRQMLNDDQLLEYVLKQALGAETKEHGVAVSLKQAAPPSPLDAALDRLRQALETARQQQGDAQLVKLLDGFTATLKPTAQGGGGARVLHDTDTPSAAREKEASVDGFFDDLGISEKPAPAPDSFDAFIFGGRKRQ